MKSRARAIPGLSILLCFALITARPAAAQTLGELLSGAQPLESFVRVVERELGRAAVAEPGGPTSAR